MKKIISAILSIALILSLGLCAFAEADTSATYESSTGGTKDITVSGTVTKPDNSTTASAVYYITVSWTSSVSLKQVADDYTWDPDADGGPKYVKNDNTGVDSSTSASVTFTITNKSNVDMYYSIGWDGTTATGGATTGVTTSVTATKGTAGTETFTNDASTKIDTAYSGTTTVTETALTGTATEHIINEAISVTALPHSANNDSITLGKFTIKISSSEISG